MPDTLLFTHSMHKTIRDIKERNKDKVTSEIFSVRKKGLNKEHLV